jgi:hypothetical protein
VSPAALAKCNSSRTGVWTTQIMPGAGRLFKCDRKVSCLVTSTVPVCSAVTSSCVGAVCSSSSGCSPHPGKSTLHAKVGLELCSVSVFNVCAETDRFGRCDEPMLHGHSECVWVNRRTQKLRLNSADRTNSNFMFIYFHVCGNVVFRCVSSLSVESNLTGMWFVSHVRLKFAELSSS